MGLRRTKESLEDRLADVEPKTVAKLSAALIANDKRPIPGNYYKYELAGRITSYFKRRDIPFGDRGYLDAERYLDKSINKEPLKGVELGMRRRGIPVDLVSRLDDFEKLYFFAGIEGIDGEEIKNKGRELDLRAMDVYEIASIYIRAGIEHMGYLHNSILETNHGGRRRKVFRGNRPEIYKNAWSPPHAKKIRKKLLKLNEIEKRMNKRKEDLVTEFQSFFEFEEFIQTYSEDQNRLDALSERIAIKLDSLKPYQLRTLTSLFERQKLGQYAVF